MEHLILEVTHFFSPQYVNILKSTKELLRILFNVWVHITNFISFIKNKTKRIIPRMFLPLLLCTWKTAVKQSVMLMSRVAQQDAPAPADQS